VIRPRLLAPWLLAASLLSCSAATPSAPRSPSVEARERGPASGDGEVVGRWLLAELLAPGGSPDSARRARARLDELKAAGMLASLARAIDDFSHGKLEASGRSFLLALQQAKVSSDPLGPLVAWFAANHLLSLDGAVPALWKEAHPWVMKTLSEPGALGWRGRGELVEWWTNHAFEEAEANLTDRAVAQLGCVNNLRIAGPFGHGAAADRWRSFPAEKAGPWPAFWPASERRAVAPKILATDRQGCMHRLGEPTINGVFYAETYLDLPAERELLLSAQSALAIWIDDHKVLERDMRTWGVWPRFGVQVRLAAGRHRVLVKLPEPETSLRIQDPTGAPVAIVSSTEAGASYVTAAPLSVKDPNLLMRYLGDGKVRAPQDELEAYLAAYAAALEGQFDVASVLLEPLLKEQENAAPLALTAAATYAEKDPIFPETDARDLARALRERAVSLDPALSFPRLWLALDRIDKGLPEAARAVQGLREEFPEVPEIGRVLVGLYGRLGWRAERARAATALLERFPHDRGALETVIPVLEEAGKLQEADALAARLRKIYPDSEIELDRAIARRDYPAAIAELKRMSQRRPERKDIADRIARLQQRAGQKVDVLASLERALKLNPRDGSARLALADARFARGDRGALRSALASAIQQGLDTRELRGAIELVEGVTELESYRVDTKEVIRQYEAASETLDGTAARVLDYSVLWVHDDGSARMLEHEIIRVQSQEAITKLAEQRVPQGALILRMRVLKKDGTVLEPERVEGKPTATMPHLEVGDYIETEHILATEGDGEGGLRYLSPHWFFREEDIAYWRSEFVVITPRHRQLTIETTGRVPPPEVKEEGPLALRRWRVDRSPAAPVEPSSPPIQEFLPSVRVGWGLHSQGQLARMLDASFDDSSRDPRLVRVAQRLVQEGGPTQDPAEKARRIYRWVLANVEDGRESDGRKVVIGKSGSRAAAFLYLARSAGLPVELAVVRDRLRDPQEGPLAAAFAFEHLVMRLEVPCPKAPCQPLWFTVGDRHAPFGFLPPELRGQPAHRLQAGLPADRTSEGGIPDGIAYEGQVKLRPDGSADLELDQRFLGRMAIGMRRNLEQVPEEQLAPAVESKLLARALPGAKLLKLTVIDREDLDRPLTFRMKIELSDFARRRGNSLVIRPPLMLKLAPFATLESRQTPLLLAEATHSEVKLTIHLPRGATVTSATGSAELKDGERRVLLRDSAQGEVLVLDRSVDVPATRIPIDAYGAFRAFAQGADEAIAREVIVTLP
jgi:tetratricopeptide (TPR) repeat protein